MFRGLSSIFGYLVNFFGIRDMDVYVVGIRRGYLDSFEGYLCLIKKG